MLSAYVMRYALGQRYANVFLNQSQHYEKPEGRLLRIVGLLPRCSEEWKTEYKKRPSIERCPLGRALHLERAGASRPCQPTAARDDQ